MVVEWTERGNWGAAEADRWQAGAASTWTDKDLYTDHSVPKGAVVFIICQNSVGDGTDVTMGVRIKGSSLSRYVALHEAEAGGGTHYGTWVKTDANGYIQYYSTTSASTCNFFIAGYLTGVDWTESFDTYTVSSGAATGFVDTTLATGASLVHYLVACNPSTGAATYLGARANGSALSTRYRSIHESEAFGTAYQTFSLAVKADASRIVELYHTNAKAEIYIDMGYFASDVDYTELNPVTAAVSTNSTWTDTDFTSSLDVDGRLCDCYVMTNSASAEVTIGARKNGTSVNRYLLEHESETNSNAGYGVPTQTDTSGIIEFYASNAATEYFGIIGYYTYTGAAATPRNFGVIIA